MSTSSGWWARKLGNPEPAAQPQGYPQQSYPATQQPSYRPPPMGQQGTDHIQVTKDNVVELAGMWQGGQGTKTETQRCPSCGSGDYFSRANVSGSRTINTNSGIAAHAAPHCFRCGFNGMYEQAGGQ